MNSTVNTYDRLMTKLLLSIVYDINIRRRGYTGLCVGFSLLLVENETFGTFPLLYDIHGEKPYLSDKYKFTLQITILDT